MNELDFYRKEIDDIDKTLVKLFEKRLDIVKKVATYKKEHDLPIFHSSREEEVIKKALNTLNNREYSEELIDYMKKIMEISKHVQFDTIK